jgi:hypothetical protein
MRLEVTTAVIAAVASVFGSAVGGGAAYLANEQQQDEEADRERQRARAIAMLETNRLQTLDQGLRVITHDRLYPARGGEIPSEVGSQDLALVVARLTVEQSKALAGARFCAATLEAELRKNEVGEPVPPELAPAFEEWRRCIGEGIDALDPLVEMEPLD